MLLTEPNRISDVLYLEGGEQFDYVRDQITLAITASALVVGTVLGQSSIGTVTSAAKVGGNTGTGTLVPDVTNPIVANAKVGIYTVTVIAVGTFIVIDPKGAQIGEGIYASSGSVTFNDQIKFAFTDTSTHFVVGDGFVVTVAAGSGNLAPLNLSAFDGSQNASAVLLAPAPINASTQISVAVDRGPALLKLNGLVWPAGITTPQITAAIAQLQVLGMVTRSDFGV